MSDDVFDDISDGDLLSVAQEATIPQVLSHPSSQPALRQTTLWGNRIQHGQSGPPAKGQALSNRPFRADLPPEGPTHHELDKEALKTWVYPLNLGAIRDYQFSIVKNGLFNNTLVALPTGLGKTFIAAAVMLNYYRWTKKAKIVFLAPTKPLAAQQVEACLNIAGIPRSKTTYLTGAVSPVDREREWETKRLFFMTPQTFENDLSKGCADPKSIALLVVDEAHRATGNYSYVKVVQFLRRFSKSFRVLALTATPGSTVESVQSVIDGLGISHVEIRTEESMDIRSYVHNRNIDVEVLDYSDELGEIRDNFSQVLKPLVDKLSQQNVWFGRDPLSITTYGLVQQQREWFSKVGHRSNDGIKFMMRAVFGILQSLAHALKLLNFHGVRPFYDNVHRFRSEVESKGEGGSKYKRQIINDPTFVKMMDRVRMWLANDDFVGHPKMTYLCDKLLNHFMDAGRDSPTRAIVFSEYRDSAEEIVRVLNKHKPMIRATVFVGQADSKKSEGMTQQKQIETIERFKNGTYNVLVATSIGEEGLDIGQVDLIICYDASASPIRMLQRMGRTGRKRAGNILLLLMRGKEEESFAKAKDRYEKMQKLICAGSEFSFRHDLSTRIVPREIKPEVDKRIVDIPIENTQDTSLPEPRKQGKAGRKAAKKKFHMPDGVETGFQLASAFGQTQKKQTKTTPKETDFLAEIPALESVLLNKAKENEFRRFYTDLPLGDDSIEDVMMPNLCAHPSFQRALSRVERVRHGRVTKRWVKVFKKMGNLQQDEGQDAMPYGERDRSRYRDLAVPPFAPEADVDDLSDSSFSERPRKRRRQPQDEFDDAGDKPKSKSRTTARSSTAQRKRATGRASYDTFDSGLSDRDETPPARRRAAKRRKPSNKLRRQGDHLAELGDDCMRTSDMDETYGSDSGADLADFIVGDDDITSSMLRGPSTSPTTISLAAETSSLPGGPSQAAPAPAGPEPFFIPTHFSQVSAADEELPDIDDLAPRPDHSTFRPRQDRSRIKAADENYDAARKRRGPGPRRKRAVLEDSDED